MGLLSAFKRLVEVIVAGRGYSVNELSRRLGISEVELLAVQPSYREFSLRKRSGGKRRILAPDDKLKSVQRRILRRLLGRLRCHPAVTGYERNRSIVTNARVHVGQAVIVQMDIKDFFPSTQAWRVRRYFRKIGWNRKATRLLVRICTHEDGLPQGAPTSPRLSNLVNYRMDARLAGLAARRRSEEIGGTYTRYADDITFSFPSDTPDMIPYVTRMTRHIVEQEGYDLHWRKKLHISRRHDRQQVTGLVVNQRVNLPRSTRRWLRAVTHRIATGKPATLTADQLTGWQALQRMIADGGPPAKGP
jgi:RNA-directed DNA polymerase